MSDLRRYVPGTALSWPGDDATAPTPLHRHVDGTLVFVDVSGFTALSERLAQRGKVGAEQLTEVLNTVFGTMLGLAAARGGTLLKFGGDALFLLFTGENHPVQAACAAVEMRSALAQTAKYPSPAGRLRLRMSVGVHTGMVDLFLVGESHRELVVVGPATTAVAELEAAASAGQILLGPRTCAALPKRAVGEPLGPGHLLRWRRAHADFPEPHWRPDGTDAGLFVPTALRQLLSAADPESEHRTVGVSFVRYTGIDGLLGNEGHEAAAESLHALVSAAQQAADDEGVTFLATDLAEDGGKVIMVAGFPTTADDDQGRLLRASRMIVQRSLEESWPIAVRAGLNRGHVFAGAIGSFDRATVTVMGDTVNLAARVMAKAEPGQVLATPATLDNAQTLFTTEAVEPFMVKGKSRPVTAYVVGEESGTRPPRGLGSLPFLGRDDELTTVLSAIDALKDGSGSVITLLGETGIGKTRLMREALSARDTVPSVQARAEPYGAATPYRPLRDPLRRLLGLDHSTAGELSTWLRETVPLFAPDLTAWLPLVGDVLAITVDDTDATRDLDPQFRPDRTADAIIRLVEVLAGGPMIIALDDAHHADDATAGLLSRLERETERQPWLVLSSRRDEDGGYRATTGRHIDLGPLDSDAVRALVNEGTAAAPLRPHDVDSIVARVAGNPLFVEETLTNLREHGDIDALPSSLEGMVAAQIDALSPLARRVVRRASVLGRSFRVGVLRDLFGDEDVALDDATQKELADILEPDGKGRLRFRHALLRDAAYDSLPFNRRRQFHLLAAESTLHRAQSRQSEYADNLALHYWMGGDYRNTWHWARMAGDQARATYANALAAIQFARALGAARKLEDVDQSEVLSTWLALADVQFEAGQFGHTKDALRQALRLSSDPAGTAAVLLRLATAHERSGDYSAALRELSRGEKAAAAASEPSRSRAIAGLLAFRARVYEAQDRYPLVEKTALEAEALARTCDADEALAQALMSREIAQQMTGRSAGGELARTALDLYTKLGAVGAQAKVYGNLGIIAFYEGRWSESSKAYRDAAATFERLGNPVQSAMAECNLGEILVLQERYPEAEPVLARASAVLRATGHLDGALFADVLLARVWAATGRDVSAVETLARTRDAMKAAGQADRAVEASVPLADVLRRQGKPTEALGILDHALADTRGDATVMVGAIALARGSALRDLGRFSDAEEVVRAGLRECAALGLDYDHARLLLLLAELREATHTSVDPSEVAHARHVLANLGVVTGSPDTVPCTS